MANLKSLIADIPSFAKDIKINIENLISEENTALPYNQILGCALASAYANEEKTVMLELENEAKMTLEQKEIDAIKSAASLMAMNNIYYRFTHLTSDEEYGKMPAGLRMKGINDHNIDKTSFEAYCLAISVINGCAMCVDAHANQLLKHGMNKSQVQMIAKIASVISAAGRAITINEIA